MELYQKITKGKRVMYQPYLPEPEPIKVLEFTDSQCVTLAGALGATLLNTFERNMPKHKLVARKIKNVENAILDLFQGCGTQIDPAMAELACQTWDKTMRELSV